MRAGGTVTFESAKTNPQDFDKRAYFEAGIVAYAKCFNSNMRTRLSQDIFKGALAPQKELHLWCMGDTKQPYRSRRSEAGAVLCRHQSRGRHILRQAPGRPPGSYAGASPRRAFWEARRVILCGQVLVSNTVRDLMCRLLIAHVLKQGVPSVNLMTTMQIARRSQLPTTAGAASRLRLAVHTCLLHASRDHDGPQRIDR